MVEATELGASVVQKKTGLTTDHLHREGVMIKGD